MKTIPNKEPILTTDEIEFTKFISKHLPSMGFSKEVDTEINKIKTDLFITLFELTKNSSSSFDSEILFDNFIEDCRDLFYLTSPSLKLLERAKAASDEE